jgi:hypothetical protein
VDRRGFRDRPIPAASQLLQANPVDCFVVQDEPRHPDASVPSRSDATFEVPGLTGKRPFSPADRMLIFSAQCRLLATRAENGLPVDVRSFLNLIRSFRDLLVAGVAR